MNKKQRAGLGGIVYSTDPAFSFEPTHEEEVSTPEKKAQKLRISLDKKQRAGKAVTLVAGFVGKTGELEDLGKALKTFCGTGGSVKEDLIIIQGDQRAKIEAYLKKLGYTGARVI